MLTVLPLKSNTAHSYDFQVLLSAAATGLDYNSKARAEQVRAVSAVRPSTRIGQVPTALMAQLDDALRLHLAP